jgi:Na+-transporting methylmalonyl-CoA/oxaloacetate decarboxylase gamma subunit
MENLGWGLQMTVLGMGLVFALLALLWGLLTLVLKFDPAPAEPLSPQEATRAAEQIAAQAGAAVGAQVPLVPTVNGIDADLVAAITAAVLMHKAVRRGEAAPAMRSYWPGSLLYASRWVASGRMRQNRSWNRGR